MFSKIDKKVLIWLVAALVVAALIGIAAYKQLLGNAGDVQNSTGGASTENTNQGNNENLQNESRQNLPDIELDLGDVQVEGGAGSGSGGLTICLDKCGDGICQTRDLDCDYNSSLNCVCPETPQECPQDCE